MIDCSSGWKCCGRKALADKVVEADPPRLEGGSTSKKAGARIDCCCGKVTIELAASKPRGHVQCACTECWQHLAWAEKQGGPKAAKIPDGIYFDNAFIGKEGEITKGIEYLQPTVLHGGAGTIRVIASCCKSTMFATSAGYLGKAIAVYPAGCKLSNAEDFPLMLRMSMIDYDEEMRGGPPTPVEKGVPVVWRGAGGMAAPRSGYNITTRMTPIFATSVKYEGYPVAKLMERLGETVDLQQPDLNKPHKALCSQICEDLKYRYPGPYIDPNVQRSEQEPLTAREAD